MNVSAIDIRAAYKRRRAIAQSPK